MKTTQERLEAATSAIKDGETRGLGRKAMDRRYKALFALDDKIKTAGGWL